MRTYMAAAAQMKEGRINSPLICRCGTLFGAEVENGS
jgi:hypothetical protein